MDETHSDETNAEAQSCDLAREECVPCKGGTPPLKGLELQSLHEKLGGGWRLVDDHHIEKEFALGDFAQAVALVNRIADLAEAQNHHPDIHLSYGKVVVSIWTHKINALTRSDFVLAARINAL